MPKLVFSRKAEKSRWSSMDDREVVLAVREGDELAFDELVRRKTRPLLEVAYRVLGDREEARDVVQIAFVRVWENRASYCEKWSPNTWIYRITTNLAIDHLRSRQSRDRAAEPLRLHIGGQKSEMQRSSLTEMKSQEVESIFRQLAEQLTEKQRAVFVLRELEGLSSREVAEIVGCRESTVRNHLFNSRKLLRAELLRRYPEYGPRGAGTMERPMESCE